MRQENLPSPGIIGNSQQLRALCAKVLSAAEIQASFNGGSTDHAAPLVEFFTACADAAEALVPVDLGITAIAPGLNTVVPQFSEDLAGDAGVTGFQVIVNGVARTGVTSNFNVSFPNQIELSFEDNLSLSDTIFVTYDSGAGSWQYAAGPVDVPSFNVQAFFI
jgi:hypothetical protein